MISWVRKSHLCSISLISCALSACGGSVASISSSSREPIRNWSAMAMKSTKKVSSRGMKLKRAIGGGLYFVRRWLLAVDRRRRCLGQRSTVNCQRLRQRQADSERRALAFFAGHGDGAAVRLDDRLGDVEAEAQAAVVAAGDVA